MPTFAETPDDIHRQISELALSDGAFHRIAVTCLEFEGNHNDDELCVVVQAKSV